MNKKCATLFYFCCCLGVSTVKSDNDNEAGFDSETTGLDNLEEQVDDLRKMMYRLFQSRNEIDRGDLGATLDDIADSVTKAAQCCRHINDMVMLIITGNVINLPHWNNETHQENWQTLLSMQQQLVGMNSRLQIVYQDLLTLQKDVEQGCIEGTGAIRMMKCNEIHSDMKNLHQQLEVSGLAWRLEKNCKVPLPDSKTILNPQDCGEVLLKGETTSGQYKITLPSGSEVEVYCDMDTTGGGWTVFQRRGVNPQEASFNETLENYKTGFGDVTKDFWLGLNTISELTMKASYVLRVDLEDWSREARFAIYMNFVVNSTNGYELTATDYVGNAGDSLVNHQGMKFSTFDNDSDTSRFNCALECSSGWWFYSCADSNLNGIYGEAEETNIFSGVMWETFRGRHYSLKKAEMKIRKSSGRQMEESEDNSEENEEVPEEETPTDTNETPVQDEATE